MRSMRGGRRRGSSLQSQAREPPVPAVSGRERFGRGPSMGSAKSMVDKKRQREVAAATEEYSGAPPPGKGSIEIRLVIPGGIMLPRGLDNPSSLDGIRKEFQVWIARVEPNIFSICGDSMPQLRQALRAINDVIHDMRLASDSAGIRFMLQKPCRHIYGALIRIDLDSRPVMQLPPYIQAQPPDFSRAIDAHVANISTELLSNLEMLTSCTTDLRMRINFGHLILRREGLKDQLTLDELASTIKIGSSRGLARLDTWLLNPEIARRMFRYLTSPESGICIHPNNVKCAHSLIVTVGDREVLLDAFVRPHDTQLSATRTAKIDKSSLLNCTIAAPDLKYDWNLQIESLDTSGDMPSDIAALIKGISLQVPTAANWDLDLPLASLRIAGLASWETRVSETRVKTSRIIPIKETPYVLDISVTTKWKGLRPQPAMSETRWQVQMYGIHWDEAVNQRKPGQRRKDWGARMENIWLEPATGSTNNDASFREFVQTVLEVQGALDKIDDTELRSG